jgi:hypothetical protein
MKLKHLNSAHRTLLKISERGPQKPLHKPDGSPRKPIYIYLSKRVSQARLVGYKLKASDLSLLELDFMKE